MQSASIGSVTGDLITFSAAGTPARVAAVAAGSYLASAGAGTLPTWATLNQAAVSGLTTSSAPTFAGVNIQGANTTADLGLFTAGLTAASGCYLRISDYAELLFCGIKTTNGAWNSLITGDTFSRYVMSANGNLAWGSGAAAVDAYLYRSGVSAMQIDSNQAGGACSLAVIDSNPPQTLGL